MAGNPAAAILLIGLGIDVLSMAATSIPPVKRALRAVSLQQAQDIAARALVADDPSEVHRLLERALEEAGLPGSSANAAPLDNCGSDGFPSRRPG
jgi:phosphotransferase system enzyme I (PtsP)